MDFSENEFDTLGLKLSNCANNDDADANSSHIIYTSDHHIDPSEDGGHLSFLSFQ